MKSGNHTEQQCQFLSGGTRELILYQLCKTKQAKNKIKCHKIWPMAYQNPCGIYLVHAVITSYLSTNFSCESLLAKVSSAKDSGCPSDVSTACKLKMNDDNNGSGAALEVAKEPPKSDWRLSSCKSFLCREWVECDPEETLRNLLLGCMLVPVKESDQLTLLVNIHLSIVYDIWLFKKFFS